MTTNAPIKGSDAKIYVVAGAGGTPVTLIGDAFDADFPRDPQQVVKNSYDTGQYVARKIIRYDGELTFKYYTNPSDAGQIILRSAVNNTPPLQITVDYAEEGNGAGAGKKGQRFTANVRLKRGSPVDQMAVTEVTLSPDGTVTEVTY